MTGQNDGFDRPITSVQLACAQISAVLAVATAVAVPIGYGYHAVELSEIVAATAWFCAVQLFLYGFMSYSRTDYRYLCVVLAQMFLSVSVYLGLVAWGVTWCWALGMALVWVVLAAVLARTILRISAVA